MKKFEFYTIIILIIIILGFGLLGCTKEKYPNKMDSIAKALSKIKKWDIVFTGFIWASVPC